MINTSKLQNIKELIEDMNKCQQIEILKLLKNDSVTMSENNNGTFINLTDLSESTINKLLTYIEFVCTQQKQLLFIENEKITIKNEFFKQEKKVLKTKKNKDKEIPNIINTS